MLETVESAMRSGAIDDLVAHLHDVPPAEIRRLAVRLSRDGETPVPILDLTPSMASHPAATVRLLACGALHRVYESDPERAADLLQQLLDDESRAVHRAAVTTAGELLRADFHGMLDRLRPWTEHPSPNIRRGAVVAAGRAAHPHHIERAEPLLKVLAPPLHDRDPSVRKSLGSSALGASMLRCYPRLTFEYLTQWSTSDDPQVLWNVASALSSPPAAAIAKKALIILRKLSLDERRFVWRAVAAAVWRLGRKCPEIVRPELARWLDDDRRSDVAREALKHL
jgi:hypothetical protein